MVNSKKVLENMSEYSKYVLSKMEEELSKLKDSSSVQDQNLGQNRKLKRLKNEERLV